MKTTSQILSVALLGLCVNSVFSQSVETLASRTNNCWAIALDATHVYWTEPSKGIRKIPKSGGAAVSLATITNASLAIAVFGNYVYWAESHYQGYGAIKMTPTSGGIISTVASNNSMGSGSGIRGLAVDSSGIYWVVSGSDNSQNFGSVRKLGGVPVNDPVALAATSPVTLATNLPNPTGLASDGSYIYWIEYNWTKPGSGAVKRVPKNGGATSLVVTGLGEVSGIAVDATNAYFGIWNSSVFRVPKSGGTATSIGGAVSSGFLGLDDDFVYSASVWSSGQIWKTPKAGGGGTSWLSGGNGSWGIAADQSGVYWTECPTCYPAGGFIRVVRNVPPSLNAQPQAQTVAAGTTAIFSVSAAGSAPLKYQWRKDGVNIAGATDSALALNSVGAADSGGYSVRVWNMAGSLVSATASLAVLTDGANGNQPTQTSPAPPPTKPPAVDSLVIVTHGFEPFGILNDVSWVNAMADAIRSHAPANWLVIPYTWEGQAWVTPGFALINARIQGGVYAKQLAQQNWQHVHLIGHSAGSAFVEAAAKAFKEVSPSTTVHSTFLDPYLSFFQVGASVYGANADWADCYFAQDATGNFTKGPLANAYSVDVTWADPNKQVSPIYCSSSTAGSTPPLLDQICGQRATSSHGYPHDFYFATIGGTAPGCASGYGFAMSKESGGWNNRGNFPVGNQPLVLCGPAPLTQNSFPFNLNGSLQINALPSGTSADGVSFSGAGFSLTTHSPAWLAVGVTVSNTVNFVQFDAGFTSTNAADGLLTAYWNTNQIGMVDERVSSTNLQSYRFALPGALTNGLYTLSFRLDPTTNITSSVTITNVKTGFSGVEEPIRLDMLLAASNNTPLLMLSGASNYNYLVESSTNLTDWTATALLVNTNGAVFFADPAVTNFSRRFYRATIP